MSEELNKRSRIAKALTEAASSVVAEVDYDMWKWYEYGEGEEPEGFESLGEIILGSLIDQGFKVVASDD